MIYLVATTCLLVGGRTGWRVAVAAVSVELVGVLAVGTWSLPRHGALPRQDGVVALRPGLRLPAARAALRRARLAARPASLRRTLG
ncbi:hypothetical protein [Nocardioides convexus]|uniref:hypothetical protein n=1 Tax=Nocardioides convexus TaxID=2712224 RepID=UPI0024187D1D|nr:hypothetical protein [Nocardioides convexus]